MKLADTINALLVGLAAFLEREGGYSIVCLTLIGVGVMLTDGASERAKTAHDLIVFATGVLARSMGSRRTTPPPGSTTTTATVQTTDTPQEPQA